MGHPWSVEGVPAPAGALSGVNSRELLAVFESSFVAPSRGFVTCVAVPLHMLGEPEKWQGGKQRAGLYLLHEAQCSSS